MNEHYTEQQRYVTLGRKGRDFLLRYRRNVIAEVSNLPDRPSQALVLPAVTVAPVSAGSGMTTRTACGIDCTSTGRVPIREPSA